MSDWETAGGALRMLPARCSALFHYPLSIQDISMMGRADLYIVGRMEASILGAGRITFGILIGTCARRQASAWGV